MTKAVMQLFLQVDKIAWCELMAVYEYSKYEIMVSNLALSNHLIPLESFASIIDMSVLLPTYMVTIYGITQRHVLKVQSSKLRI